MKQRLNAVLTDEMKNSLKRMIPQSLAAKITEAELQQLEKDLRQDILFRYHDPEYWDTDVINSTLCEIFGAEEVADAE